MEEFGLEGLEKFKKQVKFGDLIINHWVSKNNSLRKGIFIRFFKNNQIEFTELINSDGRIYTPVLDFKSKFKIIGRIFDLK